MLRQGQGWYPTSIKNPQTNDILEPMHAVLMNMLCAAAINMASTVKSIDIDNFLKDAAWAIGSIYYSVLKPHQVQHFLS